MAGRAVIASLLEEALDLGTFCVADAAAAQRGQDEVLAGAGEGLVDQIVEQTRLQWPLRLRGGIDVRALAFITLEQALAVHDLHQPQHRGVGKVRPFVQLGFVHLLDRARTQPPQRAQQVEFGSGRLGQAGLGHGVV
jgi:hypothetical protein